MKGFAYLVNAFYKIRDIWRFGSFCTFTLLLVGLTACSAGIQSQLIASVSIEMSRFGPGAQVTVTGEDFEPNTAVPIYLQAANAGHNSDLLLGTGTSDDSGALSFEFTLPDNTPNGHLTGHEARVQVSEPGGWRVTLYFEYGSVYDLDSIAEELRSANLVVETADSSPPQSLTPPIQNLRVNKEFIAVREYTDTATAVTEATWIAPSGDEIAHPNPADPGTKVTVVYEWVATPHWYQSENLIVFYAGDTQAILNGLETVLGPQFAGRETVYPTEDIPTPTAAAISTEPEPPAATPAATASYFSIAGWSPDSRWLAYWVSDQSDIDGQQPATMPGGVLQFHDVIAGETCAMSQFHTIADREASVQWSDDGSVIVVMSDGAYSGQPCQSEPFTLFADYQPSQAEQSDPTLSPDGRFRILSAQTTSENGILTYETQLVTADNGQELAAVTWQIDERLGDYSGWLGGEWVSPTQFIIYETWQQGPLLLDAEQGVVPVLTDLLNLDAIPSMADEAGFSLTARPIFSAETNAFHLLISGVGLEGNYPLARLYHAENGVVETLPYTDAYWQLGLGTWIFLDSRPVVDGYETHEIWMRRLEAAGNEWQLLASDVDGTLWSENQTEIVFAQGETAVIWQTFPGGEMLGQWETSPYWTSLVAFSPDGLFVVTTGNNPGRQWDYGLFILQR